jgi:D-alanyl-D-alanine carboxypeptidase
MIRRRHTVLLGALGCLLPAICSAQADTVKTARIQAALDSWLATRAGPEHMTGVAAYVSFGDSRSAAEAFAGRVGTAPNAPLIGRSTLFQMGSTSKSFAAAILLRLEAQERLSLNDTLGKWLPQYPAWKDVTLRRLLNMTSGIPNYSETEAVSRIWINEPERNLTAAELVNFAYPTGGPRDLPPDSGFHYSNTNYVLASMVAEKVTGRRYRDLVQDWIIRAHGLQATFYEPDGYPAAVIRRLANGYFANPACTDYQPDCKQSWNRPLMGRDVRGMSTSWAQAAGGAIASARDVDHWMRAVFTGQVVPPRQQAEWMALVSMRTGLPIADVSPGDPHGFALGLGRGILGPLGAQWFYEGMTLGYRTLYVWFADRSLMITVQTNSQPAAKEDKLNELVSAIYAVVTEPDK